VTAAPTSLFGRRMTRVEDGALLRGLGRFVDDSTSRGAACRVHRSPMAMADERHRRERRQAFPACTAC